MSPSTSIPKRYEATWTDDGWQTIHTANSRTLESAGYSADIAPATGSSEVERTLRWPEKDGLVTT